MVQHQTVIGRTHPSHYDDNDHHHRHRHCHPKQNAPFQTKSDFFIRRITSSGFFEKARAIKLGPFCSVYPIVGEGIPGPALGFNQMKIEMKTGRYMQNVYPFIIFRDRTSASIMLTGQFRHIYPPENGPLFLISRIYASH